MCNNTCDSIERMCSLLWLSGYFSNTNIENAISLLESPV